MAQTYPPNPFSDWDYSDQCRTGEYIVGELNGEIGGRLFDKAFAVNRTFKPSTLVALSSVADATNGLLVPWDPASADAGTKALKGILHYPLWAGSYTSASVPVIFMARGPQKVRSYEGRLVYPATVAYAAMVAALAALGLTVEETAPPPFAPIL